MAQARQPTSKTAGSSGAGAAPAAEPTHPACTVSFCPICAVVTSVGDLRPELVEHLLAAGREFLLAVRSAIDTRLEETKPGKARLERLTIE